MCVSFQVSYIKFVDIWLFTCTVFVFMALLQVPICSLIVSRLSTQTTGTKSAACKEKDTKETLAIYEKHLEKIIAMFKGVQFHQKEEIKPDDNITESAKKLDPESVHRKLNIWCRYLFFCLYLVTIIVMFASFA